MALGDGFKDIVAVLAYAAGIIDGEGYIGIKCSEREHVQRSRSHRVYIAVSNTDELMIDFLHKHFGGSVEYKEFTNGAKPQYRWRTSAKNAVDFLKYILPYLITKRRQAEVAIMMQESVNDVNKAKGLSEETLAFRDACMQEIHNLNQRRC